MAAGIADPPRHCPREPLSARRLSARAITARCRSSFGDRAQHGLHRLAARPARCRYQHDLCGEVFAEAGAYCVAGGNHDRAVVEITRGAGLLRGQTPRRAGAGRRGRSPRLFQTASAPGNRPGDGTGVRIPRGVGSRRCFRRDQTHRAAAGFHDRLRADDAGRDAAQPRRARKTESR